MEYSGLKLEGNRKNERQLTKVLDGLLAEKELLLQHLENAKDRPQEIEAATKSLKIVQEKIEEIKKSLNSADQKRKKYDFVIFIVLV